MSGICGILYKYGRQVEPGTIKDMNSKISHRGADGSKVWFKGPVALGHQMLHTTVESIHEKLPWEERSSGLVITADARIDNRHELSPLLGIENSVKIPDSTFILKAYEKWGESCPEYLLGDFSFAIWDPEEERLFCARDHMGVKPFYYYQSDDLFLFASEIKAINGILPEEPEINELAIAQYLALFYDDREITFYINVHRLPSGHNLSIDFKDCCIGEYWKLNPTLELPAKSDEEYEKIFLDLFFDSVKCRLRSEFALGFTLSGGLDSSSVLCTAKKIFNGTESVPIHTYSWVFDELPEVDESFYINSVLENFDYHKHYIRGDNTSPLFEINKMFWYRDSPTIGPNAFLNWKLYEKAKDDVRVILTGFDGDTVLSRPYVYLTELFLNLQFKRLFSEIKCLSKRFDNSHKFYLKNYILSPLIPDFWRSFRKKKSIISKNFAKMHEMDEYDNYADTVSKISKKLKNYHYYQITTGHIQKTLEYWDGISAAFSIDTRHPFFDKRMVEFCYALPPEQKLKAGWDRIIMRRAMNNILPKKVQWRRSKSNLSENFRRSLLFEKKNLNNIICENNQNLEKYVQINELINTYHRFKSQGSDASKIWFTITLALWLKCFENLQNK